ncbi:MAG TPA: AAA family ATPase [Streptosporangiaceae bacterium]|nr:AAA family ATPase [Streptosporangiaceae bacterium]
MANHEQDQTPATGPAGNEARDSEDEGTFRWPTTGLPKLFGRQSADEEAELPDDDSGGTPPAGQAADRQHALSAAPPPYRAPFSRAAYGHLLVPPPAPDAGGTDEGEQPPWSPAPPPPGTAQQAAPPAAETPQPAEAGASAEDAGPAGSARTEPEEGARLAGTEPEEGARLAGAESEQAAGPAGAESEEAAGPAGAVGFMPEQDQMWVPASAESVPASAETQEQAAGPAAAEAQEQSAGPAAAEAQEQAAGPAAAEAHSPAEVYGTAAAYGPEEYDPPDGYPMAEYDTGTAAVPPVEPVPATEPEPPPVEPAQAVEAVPPVEPVPPPSEPTHWQHAETADSLTADLLLPGRHVAPPSGWRRAIYQVTGGLVRPPLSAAEMRRRELVARACTPVAAGHYRVAVLSLKGGVGKTTTVMGLGSTLASLRGDRVIAVDANPDRGTLSDKLRLETAATVRDLLNEREQIQRYADVRAFTTQAASRLEVLASDRDPTVSVAFSDRDYEDVSQVLEHYYSICITDCGTGLLHSAMAGVLRLADQIVLVSSPSVDGARSASATLDWLQAHGYGDLVRDGVVALAVVRPRGKSTIDLERLEQHFATRCRAVVRVPYDAHLEEGAEVELNQLSKATADAYLALAAEVGDGFSWPHRASADN